MTVEDSALHDVYLDDYIGAINKSFVSIFHAFDMDYDIVTDDNMSLHDFFEEVMA